MARARMLLGDSSSAIAEAAALLEKGELVAFPTETVYGLGADARSEAAVEKIYEAKGRPAQNPIIVHVADASEAARVVEGWDERAEALARALWPGPLALVLKRNPAIPAIVAAGGDTLAVRAPAHPIARMLLRKFGGPIAAPSANRSNAVSPTKAEHVLDELGEKIRLILDGGPCSIGLESTVLDLTQDTPTVLRPGAIVPSMIGEILGEDVRSAGDPQATLRSPGQMRRHYSTRRPLHVAAREEIEQLGMKGFHASVVLTFGEWSPPPPAAAVRALPAEAEGYAHALYDVLRWADEQPVQDIWLERPPHGENWAAVHDRLNRAAAREE